MNILATFNANEFEPTNYEPRVTAKAVILNQENQLLLFGHFLIGGGVEEGESVEEGLSRECMEEAGAVVEIVRPIGTIIQYRDALEKRYEVFGFLTKYIKTVSLPTTTQSDEIGKVATWYSFDEVISVLEDRIKNLEQAGPLQYEGDTYQSKLFNAKTHLVLIKEAQRMI